MRPDLAPLRTQVAKADVVVASYEALASDGGALGALPWELIAVDERTRAGPALGRVYQALAGCDTRARALVSSPAHLQQVGTAARAQPDTLLACKLLQQESSRRRGLDQKT